MWRIIVSVSAGIAISFFSSAQVKKQFFIEQSENFGKVEMKFVTKSGLCYVKPSQHDIPLSIYSNQDFDDYEHSFTKEIENEICYVDLSLTDKSSDNLSRSISYQMFASNKSEKDKIWKVYLSQETTYRLNFNYGIGDAYIDLSGLSIENLKVYSVNADVNIDYMSTLGNQIDMDTFFVKVDLGSIDIKKMNLSNAKTVLADVGFGNLSLDYSNTPETKSNVQASVGAGNLLIKIPAENVPVKIKINDSMLCRVHLSNNFKEIESDTYVNKAYTDNAENLLSFDIDVALGSIVFKEKK
ncbi:MAG: hypothetical protein OEW67_04975 [Cyclobacteriaceae bacterium]|nr:hypothetical protein [Cyclobacteriaceae bacterium]